MASGSGLQGLSRILKLSLDAVMANRPKPQTENLNTQNANQAESSINTQENVQEADNVDKINTHASEKNGISLCTRENVFRGQIYKSGRGRGRSLRQQSNTDNFLQESKASNSCYIQSGDSHSVTDPIVHNEEGKTARDITAATSASSLVHCVEQCQNMIVSDKADIEVLSVQQHDNCELPDLVKCQISHEVTDVPMAAKTDFTSSSGLEQSIVNKLPLLDKSEKVTSTQASSSSSCNITTEGIKTSSSQFIKKCIGGYKITHAQISSQPAKSRTGKHTSPSHKDLSRTVIKHALQENGKRYNDKQVKPWSKTYVDLKVSHISKDANKSGVVIQHETCAKERKWSQGTFFSTNRKQNHYKDKCLIDRNVFQNKVFDSSRKDACHRVNKIIRQDVITYSTHQQHSMSTDEHDRVRKHVEPAAEVTNEVTVIAPDSSNQTCHNGTELKHVGVQSLPEEPNHLFKNTDDLEKDQTACSGSHLDPSLCEMINAIYQSYERKMMPNNDKQSETIEDRNEVTKNGPHEYTPDETGIEYAKNTNTNYLVCPHEENIFKNGVSNTQERREMQSDYTIIVSSSEVPPLSDPCSKSCLDFASSSCPKANYTPEGAMHSQCVSQPIKMLDKQSSSFNTDSCCDNLPHCHITSQEMPVLAEAQPEVVFVLCDDHCDDVSVVFGDHYEMSLPSGDKSEMGCLAVIDESEKSLHAGGKSGKIFLPTGDNSEKIYIPDGDKSEKIYLSADDKSDMLYLSTGDRSEKSLPAGDKSEKFLCSEDKYEMLHLPSGNKSEKMLHLPAGDKSMKNVHVRDKSEKMLYLTASDKSERMLHLPAGDKSKKYVYVRDKSENTLEHFDKSLPPGDEHKKLSMTTEDKSRKFLPAGDKCDKSLNAGNQSEMISFTSGFQTELSFPSGDQSVEKTAPLEVDCDEGTLNAEFHTSKYCIQPNDFRKSNDVMHSYYPQYTHFQTRELSLPAETVSTKLSIERMVAFVKSCSADIQELMDRCNENQPVDVTIRISLSPPMSSSHVSRHSYNHNSRHTESTMSNNYAPSYMFPTPNPPPAPPFNWHSLPWSECYSPNMNMPINSVHPLNAWYPGMVHPPQVDNRRMPAVGYPSPWIYPFWNSSQFGEERHGTDRTYAHRQSPKQAWDKEETTVDYHSDRPLNSAPETAETENRINEAPSVQLTKPVSSPDTNKWCQNKDPNINDFHSTWDTTSNENVSVPERRFSQKNDNSARCSHPVAANSFMSADITGNVKTPPSASRGFRNHLTSRGSGRSNSSGSSFTSESIQSEGHTSSSAFDSDMKHDFISKINNKSLRKINKYETATQRQGCSTGLRFEQVSPQSDNRPWRRRHSFPHQEKHLKTKHSMTSQHEAYEVQPQSSQVGRRLSVPSEGRVEKCMRSFQQSSSVEENRAHALEMATIPLQSAKSKRMNQAVERTSLLVTRSRSYKYTFIDCHCHIDFLYSRMDVPRETAFSKFMENHSDSFPYNYEGCVAVFCNPNTFNANYPKDQILKSIAAEDGVWLAVGCHPKNAPEFETSHLTGLKQILQHPKVVALGEIGLDYSGGFDQHSEKQKQVFRQQLNLALEMKLPLVIHCRDADDDCLEILTQTVPRDHKIHAHCFTRDITVAERWMKPFPNLFLGLTPVITYKTAVDAANTATHIPLDRLLLETDAPYFVPGSLKNGALEFSHPGLALCTAERVAELRRIPVDDVLRACRENTYKMYGI